MASSRTRAIRAAADTADPLVAKNAILCNDLTLRFLEGDYQAREFATGDEGAQIEELYNKHSGAQFMLEAAGGGAADTPPKYADLLKACGLTETIVDATSVSYSPTPMGAAKAEARLELRSGVATSVVRKARGALTFTAETNRKPMIGFNILGEYQGPTDGVLNGLDFTGWRKALECSPANMNAFTFNGTTLCVRSFTFTDGRTPRLGRFMNCDGTDITHRRFTGRMTIEWPDRSTMDLIALCAAASTHAFVWQLGSVAGDIVRVAAPAVQIKFAGEQDIDGTMGANLDLVFTPVSGDDEIALIFK
ncbi:MAG: hypothetical protein JJ894_03165 [Dinoroseobacter sp.]|nr:hypothetical protein [Dinoroseobacter sp.]